MKKVTLLAVAALAVSLASCKKDHTCTCTDSSSGTAFVSVVKAKSSKKDGAAWCTGSTSTTTYGGVAVTGGTKPTCVFA